MAKSEKIEKKNVFYLDPVPASQPEKIYTAGQGPFQDFQVDLLTWSNMGLRKGSSALKLHDIWPVLLLNTTEKADFSQVSILKFEF